MGLNPLFPGFSERWLDGARAPIFARIGGSGPPLLLLHGYPQTHTCWHKVAVRLAQQFTVVACDLPGYGDSHSPGEGGPLAYSKRAIGADLAHAMQRLALDRFAVAGHDRGGRVAYRMALDHSAHVSQLAVVSILPTFAMWRRLADNRYAMQAFRWFFLAQPAPLPERLIGAAAIPYLHATLAGWTAAKDLSAFAPEALAAYETAFARPSVIAAGCQDYRAGWLVDRLDDEQDLARGHKIACPTLVLWGRAEFPDDDDVLPAWREIAIEAEERAIGAGHFLPEEAPEETASALLDFFVR
jgi:haloacetate dehalogenase